MGNDRIGIIVASHLESSLPDDPMYIPVMAGAALKKTVPEGYIRDDTGDNISDRNTGYCELTALYWGWKQLDMDYIGLCHYRRFFASQEDRRKLLKKDEAEHLLQHYDVLLPKARDYVIETNYSQYIHSHHAEDLELTRSIIAERYPGYLESYDRRMSLTKGHRFNMFIMRKDLLDEYCGWLFGILFELENRLDTTSYDVKDKRVFGYVAERLIDVWIDENGVRTADLDYVFFGREKLLKKAASMCIRKLRSHLSK